VGLLDPALTASVAVNVLWWGWQVMKESVGGLIDEAVLEKTLNGIPVVISSSGEGALEVHDLRTRHAGKMTCVDFHLVAGEMSIASAYGICRIEHALRARLSTR
jgi:divalent metal cation (Fe/Co/Zn/Cd) transporter